MNQTAMNKTVVNKAVANKALANKKLIRFILALLLLLAIIAGLSFRDQFDVLLLEQWLKQAGWLAPLIFILVYACATVLFLPGSILTLAGGALFGPLFGVFYNLTGATLGAALSFLIARYLASSWVSQRSGGRLKQLIHGVEAEGWRFVAFARLMPLFPFNLLNYALGLTKIRFIEYFLASYVFMLPGAIAYTYLGYAGREAISGGDGLIKTALIALALLAMVMFLPRFIARLRRGAGINVAELQRRIKQQQTLVLDVRSENDFLAKGHIEQAVNIPLEQLAQQLPRLEPQLEQSISIVCDTDKASEKAADLLLKHGFQDVRVLAGGMAAWFKAAEKSSAIN